MIDYRDVPIYVTNKNRLDVGFRAQINWWLDTGMRDITVLDNGSTYPSLLKFYEEIKDRIFITTISNVGERAPWAFWDLGFKDKYPDSMVIVNDSDCPPDESCPKDLVQQLINILTEYPECKKVSAGLRIDDIPDHYAGKKKVLDAECHYWKDRVIPEILGLPKLFNAHTDTTLTLYRNGNLVGWNDQQFRTDFPYVCKHHPWYSNNNLMGQTPEEIYYVKHLGDGWKGWQQ